MAQPTNTFDRYDAVGVREDLSDVITNVAPYETPFYSASRKVSASQTFHEWQTDGLAASADNKHIEGDDTTAVALTPTVRLGNYTQIMKKSFTISGTLEATDRAGRAKEAAYQKVKKTREIRLDMEKAMFLNNARVAGNSTTAREFAGAPVWLTTNTSAGTGGADATGDGTDARTNGTQRAFSEALLNPVLQSIWENGGNPDTVYLSPAGQTIAAGFEGNAPRRHTDTGDGTVNNFIDIYVTSWGRVKFQPSREIAARDVLIVESSMWCVADLRPLTSTMLAKTGDSDKYQMVMESTLVCKNEAASGGVFDVGG